MEEKEITPYEEKIETINKIIDKIDPEDRAVFIYKFAENEYRRGLYEGQEIAAVLGKKLKEAGKKKIITG